MKYLFRALILLVCLLAGSLFAQQEDATLAPKSLQRGVDTRSADAFARQAVEKEQEVARYVDAYYAAAADRRPAMRQVLRQLLDELFELKVREREARLRELRQEVESLETSLRNSQSQKEAIIDQRLKQLVPTP